ncbi:hypothetical protein [Streptomyces yaizuensis]|uniref:Uncharacterized protein n=1 Tax=Streptomyces yaizuensis TaxID=2989713 RepID=A0ABQ5P387_9ACTN|nr:hypothetical protein [Streptomyces sp. YSPA8]GLF96967.1 hypothetical protein SYYSPA8_21740 [Streptomyces sp. YSPA8]
MSQQEIAALRPGATPSPFLAERFDPAADPLVDPLDLDGPARVGAVNTSHWLGEFAQPARFGADRN